MRLLYMVYRVHEQDASCGHDTDDDYGYSSSPSVTIRMPIAGYEKKEDAVAHVKAAINARGGLVGGFVFNPWDAFLKHSDPTPYYEAGTLPIVFPTSIEVATKELPAAVEVLRDQMLETNDKALAVELPAVPIVFPLWSTTNYSNGVVEHYFDGKNKGSPYSPSNAAPCGVVLGQVAYQLPRVVGGRRQCKTCLKLMAK